MIISSHLLGAERKYGSGGRNPRNSLILGPIINFCNSSPASRICVYFITKKQAINLFLQFQSFFIYFPIWL